MIQENSRKKILLVTRPIAPPWDEASKNFAFYLAKNISSQEFYLLTNGVIPDLPQNVRQKPIYTSNDFSYLQKLRLLKHLRKMRNEFDILHYIFTPTKQNTFLIKRLLSCKQNKCAKTIQTIATLREDLYSDREIKDLIFGDFIVTYSEYAKNKLNQLGFENVERIYPGIDLEYYSPAAKNSVLMKKFNIGPGDFVVTYPGEYSRLGVTDDLVEMLVKNSAWITKNRMKFIFACRIKNKSDFEKREEIAQKLQKNDLSDKVVFTDTFPEMNKLYNLSDLIIFPVRDMQGKFDVPLVIVEAMACGKTVIVSDLPILEEFANDQNSVRIKNGDMEQLFSVIARLREKPIERENIGRVARQFAEDNFDIQKVAEIYRQIYEKL